MELPKLNDGWYWNPIEELLKNSGHHIAREYRISVSRKSGLPKYYSTSVFISVNLDTEEIIKESFNNAFEGLAAATFTKQRNQPNWDTLDSILNEYEKSRFSG